MSESDVIQWLTDHETLLRPPEWTAKFLVYCVELQKANQPFPSPRKAAGHPVPDQGKPVHIGLSPLANGTGERRDREARRIMRISEVAHRIPGAFCPWCKATLDGASGVDEDARPEVGDLGVCIQCGGLLEYGIGFVLQRGSDAVLAAEPPDIQAKIRAAQIAVAGIHRPRKPN